MCFSATLMSQGYGIGLFGTMLPMSRRRKKNAQGHLHQSIFFFLYMHWHCVALIITLHKTKEGCHCMRRRIDIQSPICAIHGNGRRRLREECKFVVWRSQGNLSSSETKNTEGRILLPLLLRISVEKANCSCNTSVKVLFYIYVYFILYICRIYILELNCFLSVMYENKYLKL